MAYATAADVAQLWARELTDEETALVERRLEQVERLIKRRVPDLDAKVLAGDIAEDDLIDVESEAVLRVVRNPEGLYSEQDGSYMYQRSREAADNSLRILASEWAVLGVRAGRMFAIDPLMVRPQREPS